MNTFKTVVLAVAGCGMALAAGFAASQEKPDFVFHVPVGLRSMHPDIKPNSLMVQCRVFKVQGNYTADNVVATSFGAGREYARVNVDAKGYFNGVVRVNAYTNRGKNASDGKYYECDLWMDGHAIDSGRSKGPQFESKAGTERRVQVSGPIR
jgi:hypothetical protein